MKEAIINTFHSIYEIKSKHILSFDSHVDSWFGIMSPGVADAIDELSDTDRAVWERHYVHYAQSRQAKVHIVIPWRALFGAQLATLNEMQRLIGEEAGGIFGLVEAYKKMLSILNIEIETIPPNSICNLLKKIPKGTPIDIDMDYLSEYQDICFTKAPGVIAEKRIKEMIQLTEEQYEKLGNMDTVMNCIRSIKPKIIFISELTEKGLRKAEKNFFPTLEGMGYDINYFDGYLLPDIEATPALSKYDAYWKTATQPVLKANTDLSAMFSKLPFENKKQTSMMVNAVKEYTSWIPPKQSL